MNRSLRPAPFDITFVYGFLPQISDLCEKKKTKKKLGFMDIIDDEILLQAHVF